MYARTGMKRSCVSKRKKFFMIIATKIIAKTLDMYAQRFNKNRRRHCPNTLSLTLRSLQITRIILAEGTPMKYSKGDLSKLSAIDASNSLYSGREYRYWVKAITINPVKMCRTNRQGNTLVLGSLCCWTRCSSKVAKGVSGYAENGITD
jgi:hypothetical protein